VGLIPEYYVYYFRYLSCFIWGIVNIIYKYGPRELASTVTMLLYETPVDKNSSSSRADQGMYQERSGDVYSFKKDKEV